MKWIRSDHELLDDRSFNIISFEPARPRLMKRNAPFMDGHLPIQQTRQCPFVYILIERSVTFPFDETLCAIHEQ